MLSSCIFILVFILLTQPLENRVEEKEEGKETKVARGYLKVLLEEDRSSRTYLFHRGEPDGWSVVGNSVTYFSMVYFLCVSHKN